MTEELLYINLVKVMSAHKDVFLSKKKEKPAEDHTVDREPVNPVKRSQQKCDMLPMW